MFEDIFKRRKSVPSKLLEYGFEQRDGKYQYKIGIMNGEFALLITIDADDNVDTFLYEKGTGEEYVLYKTNAAGTYIGEIRTAITDILQDISSKCYQPSVFKAPQTLRMIDYVSDAYGDELEFLWTKFPDNAVWRRKDTMKWYGAILTVQRSKLGLDSNKQVEIIDLRIASEQMAELLKRENFYPGWHMNKKSWYTVILDESVSDEELLSLIQDSYELAAK
ncbi:MAG: MmcQ/YjbR family DNA-binding protein [Lachnospiraceae bacterium]|nr:MmcQ/YjbR family DNA-binding protein [Lachnospiraceae bacterium]